MERNSPAAKHTLALGYAQYEGLTGSLDHNIWGNTREVRLFGCNETESQYAQKVEHRYS
jgi:hypothetical protein